MCLYVMDGGIHNPYLNTAIRTAALKYLERAQNKDPIQHHVLPPAMVNVGIVPAYMECTDIRTELNLLVAKIDGVLDKVFALQELNNLTSRCGPKKNICDLK